MCNKISINDWCMKNTSSSQPLLLSLAKTHNPMLKPQQIRPSECFPICRCCTDQDVWLQHFYSALGQTSSNPQICLQQKKKEKSMTGPSHLVQVPSEPEQIAGGNIQSLGRPSPGRCCKLDELVPGWKKYKGIQLYEYINLSVAELRSNFQYLSPVCSRPDRG